MNFRSTNHFLEFSIIGRKFCSRDDRHVALPAVPGWSPGRGHSGHAVQPEYARGNTLAGHVAHSEASGEITLAGLAAPSGASGRVLCAWVLGTRGAFGKYPGFSRGGSRDTWCARKVSGRGGFTLKHSGTRGSLATPPGIYSRDTWLSYQRYPGGGSRCE